MGNMFQVNLFTHDKTLFKQVFSDGCSEKPAPLRKTSRISLNEALSACRRAPAPAIATCSFHPDPPNWSDAQTALPVTLTDCQEQRPTSREIVPSNDEEPSLPAVRSAHAQLRATMFGISHARKEKGKIRPVGTISRDVMHYNIGFCDMHQMPYIHQVLRGKCGIVNANVSRIAPLIICSSTGFMTGPPRGGTGFVAGIPRHIRGRSRRLLRRPDGEWSR